MASNLRRAAELIARAVGEGARFVALPECFVGKYGVEHFAGHAEALPARDASTGAGVLAAAAREHGVVTTGGVIEAAGGRLWNSFPAYDASGARVATYRKVHLSRVLGITAESDVLAAGDSLTTFDSGGGFRAGAACCFDLRFPEWLRGYGPRGAAPVDLLSAPSAFLDVTGRDHWDLLLRRTALDGQCYVVAPNVAFDGDDDVPLHGRAAVVSPWGTILAQTGASGDDLAVADVERSAIDETRAKIPLAGWAE